jgi:hypothetical protein
MDAEFIIGNYLLDINLVHLSQTLAMRTGTFGRVEGEHVQYLLYRKCQVCGEG